MVQYEVALILRSVPTAELSQLLKKTLSVVLDQGAVLRKVENLGERQLPYRMRAHSKYFQDGRYLVFNMDASPQMAITIRNKLRANADTIRTTLLKGGA
ncbi:hypothetical protein EMCRGX_G010186 [Ephydatia muelleri]|eukprot:Em0003g1471a